MKSTEFALAYVTLCHERPIEGVCAVSAGDMTVITSVTTL